MSVVLCNSSKLATLSQHAEQCPSLKTVVTIGAEPAGEEEREKIERSGLKLFSMKDVEVYTLVGNFWGRNFHNPWEIMQLLVLHISLIYIII